MKEIFNVISYLADRRWKENKENIADAWQRLVVGGDSPQSNALSMVIHRMTACKETTDLQSCASFNSSDTSAC